MPIYPGLVQGHLLCAGQEFPLAGPLNVSAIVQHSLEHERFEELLGDGDLCGSKHVYQEVLDGLMSQG
jgi:DEAD/DEAH box helicase domain-containing protein